MLLEGIRDHLKSLAPAEAKVAQLALAQPNAFIQTAIVKIAAQAGVSQPTVVRFCRSMGATGLRDFKLRLAATLQNKSSGPHPSVNADDSIENLSIKVLDAGVNAIHSVGASLDLGVLQQVLRALKQARRVDFVGIGQSALVAQDAKQKFFRFGLHCEAYSDPADRRTEDSGSPREPWRAARRSRRPARGVPTSDTVSIGARKMKARRRWRAAGPNFSSRNVRNGAWTSPARSRMTELKLARISARLPPVSFCTDNDTTNIWMSSSPHLSAIDCSASRKSAP